MRRILTAFRALFAALFSGAAARRIDAALAGAGPAEPAPAKVKAKPPPKPALPARSEALTLLATLQRESRLVDFVYESLDGYTDAQVGAAVRDVHRHCRAVLDRLFDLKPMLEEAEGAEVEVPAGFDAGRFRLTGKVTGEPPFRGKLVHHGWEAGKCELPAWSGSKAAVRVLAPSEVELE
jgi:hypothetical protein